MQGGTAASPPNGITVYEFIPRDGNTKPRFVHCREGRVLRGGPDVTDAEWALALVYETAVAVCPGRTNMRPFDAKLDVIERRRGGF